MTFVITMNCMMFLLGHIIFSTVTEVAAHENILETVIIDENIQEIPLRWVESVSFVANEHLPVWLTVSLEYVQRDRNVMKEIGKFRTYYDLEKSSAILLFEKWNCIYGVVDVRYSINCLPMDQLHMPQIIGDSPYVTMMDDPDSPEHVRPLDLSRTSASHPSATTSDANSQNFNMLIKTLVNLHKPSTSHSPQCVKHEGGHAANMPSTSHADPSPSKRPRVNENYEDQVITVYPEILIFITEEIRRTMPELRYLVVHYLIQFNAVAMLFAKLASHNIKIHVNIAGIVIETRDHKFQSTSLFEEGRPSSSAVLNSMTEYIKRIKNIQTMRNTNGNLFVDDSFDMFLLSTTKEWQERAGNPGGTSNEVFDLMDNRKIRSRISDKKFLGSIVDGTRFIRHYVNAAREIAHLMTVGDDPQDYDLCDNGDQCHAIMQVGNQHCPNCLTWSRKSINSFKQYLSVNTNRCFLRNLPRSFHPFGYPVMSLTPADQCLCYGFMPSSEITHLNGRARRNVCNKQLKCGSRYNAELDLRVDLLPVDGTPCDEGADNEVCWRKKCISTRSFIYNGNPL